MKTLFAFDKPVLAVAIAVLLLVAGCAGRSPAPVYGRDGQLSSGAKGVADKDTYVVKSGDTLYSIAREHGMDPRELIAMNSIANPNSLKVGRVLKIKPQQENASVASALPVTTDVVVAKPIESGAGVENQHPGSGNTETLKREPQAGKVPYSEQALALAQSQSQSQGRPNPAEPVASAAVPESKPTDAAANGDEVAWEWPSGGKILGTYSEGGNKGIDIAGKAGDPVIAASEGKVIFASFLRGYGKLVVVKHNKTYVSVYGHNRAILVKDGQTVSKGQKIAEMGNTDAEQVKLHFEIRSKGKPLDPIKFLPQR